MKISTFFDQLGVHYLTTLQALKQSGEFRSDLDTAAAGRILASHVDGMILHRGFFGIQQKRNVNLCKGAVDLFMRGLRQTSG